MKLNYLQRIACLCITGAIRNTPQVVLEQVVLEDFIEFEDMKTAYRFEKFVTHNRSINYSHTVSLSKLISTYKVLEAHSDRLPKPIFLFDRQFGLVTTHDTGEVARLVEGANASFFTDASVTTEGGGIAIYNKTSNQSSAFPMGKYASI